MYSAVYTDDTIVIIIINKSSTGYYLLKLEMA